MHSSQRCVCVFADSVFLHTKTRRLTHEKKKDYAFQAAFSCCCNRHENSPFVTITRPTRRGKDSFIRADFYLVKRVNSSRSVETR